MTPSSHTGIDFSQLSLKYIDDIDPTEYHSFSCERQELTSFLLEDALDYHADNITRTALVFIGQDLVGFFSLSSDAIRLTESEVFDLGLRDNYPITYFPAVKITKIAVDSKFKRQGLGSAILDLIQGLVYSSPMAVRFITLDAINTPEVLSFYEKNGFIESLQQASERKQQRQKTTILMHKDIYSE